MIYAKEQLKLFIENHKQILKQYGYDHNKLIKQLYGNKEYYGGDGSPTNAWAFTLLTQKNLELFKGKIPVQLWSYVAVDTKEPCYTLSLEFTKKAFNDVVENAPDLIIPYNYGDKWNEECDWNGIDRINVKSKYFRQLVFEVGNIDLRTTRLIYDECQEITQKDLDAIKQTILSKKENEKSNPWFFYSYFFTENEAESAFDEFFGDILPNLKDNGLDDTERLTETPSRRGQGLYRRLLMQYWDNKCAVTECDIPQALRASHAMPWAECKKAKQRINKYNGFLLNANLDALFDKGLITFDDNGCIKISKTISKENKDALGINENMHLRKQLEPKHLEFLHYHQEHVWVDRE